MANSTARSIEYLLLSIAWLSVLACLVRTDYNFAFALLCYYLWITSKDKSICTAIMAIMAVLFVVDLIWLICIGGIWTKELKDNKVWNHMHGLHVFAIIISVAEAILKIVVIVMVNNHKKKLEQNEVSNPNINNFNDSGFGVNKKQDNSYMMY